METKIYGIGLVVSIAAMLIKRNQKDVATWMNVRRIDNKGKQKDPTKRTCGVCGSEMVLKNRYTGKEAGKSYWVCSNYPECRKVEKIEQAEKTVCN